MNRLPILLLLLSLAVVSAPSVAGALTIHAPGVHVSIGGPVMVAPVPRVIVAPPPPVAYVPPRPVMMPPPVVVAPRPVVVAPRPVVVAPRPVVVAPRPVVVAPPVIAPRPVMVAPRPVVPGPAVGGWVVAPGGGPRGGYYNKQARTNAIATTQIRQANQINAIMIRNNLNALHR